MDGFERPEGFETMERWGQSHEAVALIEAIEEGDEARALVLLAAGAPPNAWNGDGDTALILARSGELAAALLAKGADPRLPGVEGGAMLCAALAATRLYLSGREEASPAELESRRGLAVAKICAMSRAGVSLHEVDELSGLAPWRAMSILGDLSHRVLSALAEAERQELDESSGEGSASAEALRI